MDERLMNILWPPNILRMALCWMFALFYSYAQLFIATILGTLKVYKRQRPWESSCKPVCIITGATTGLGKSTAALLSVYGYHVILAGRSFADLTKVVAEIEQIHQGASLKAIELDLCSEASILRFKDSVKDWLKMLGLPESLQILINNAGVLKTSKQLTTSGFDSMMMSNYLGAFKVTNILLPLLKSSTTPSRIVIVASFTHRCVSQLQIDKMHLASGNMQGMTSCQRYRLAHIYEASKLCLLLFAHELHQQLYVNADKHRVTVMAADPGVVQTCIWRELPPWLTALTFAFLKFLCLLQSPEEGCSSIVDAVLASPELSGLYFFGGYGRTIKPSDLAFDRALSRKLWEVSASLFHV